MDLCQDLWFDHIYWLLIDNLTEARSAKVACPTAYIEPGSPWKNGYCESFNARFRDELLNGEIGAVRRMRTRIELLVQPESMRSIIGATQ